MLKTILLVGSGGFIGSVMRYLLQYHMEKNLALAFPWGTLTANIAGSFLIGIIFALAERGNFFNSEWRMFLAVGVCGGFTTFSAFAYNNYTMLKENTLLPLLLNVGGNIILAILAVYLGVVLVRMFY